MKKRLTFHLPNTRKTARNAAYNRALARKRVRARAQRRKRVRIIAPKYLIIGGVVVALLVVLFIVSLAPGPRLLNTAELASIRNRGVLRVGVLEDMPGYSQSGDGLEVALARRLAQEVFENGDSDTTLELRSITPRSAFAHLSSDDVDIVIAQLTGDNNSAYAYSAPYYQDACVLVTLRANANTDLTGARIGAIKNSASRQCITNYFADNAADVSVAIYSSYPDMLNALKNGTILAAAMPMAYARGYVGSAYSLHAQTIGSIPYVAAAYSENSAIIDLFSLIVDEMRSDGTLDSLYAQYGLS